MKLKDGRVTILFDHLGLTIELHDWESMVTFATVRLDEQQVCQALSRLGYAKCNINVFDLDKVGKVLETNPMNFEVPKHDKTVACEIAKKVCPKGWEPDLQFNAQGSFTYKDDKVIAHTVIRRWVSKNERKGD